MHSVGNGVQWIIPREMVSGLGKIYVGMCSIILGIQFPHLPANVHFVSKDTLTHVDVGELKKEKCRKGGKLLNDHPRKVEKLYGRNSDITLGLVL